MFRIENRPQIATIGCGVNSVVVVAQLAEQSKKGPGMAQSFKKQCENLFRIMKRPHIETTGRKKDRESVNSSRMRETDRQTDWP